MGRKKFNVTQRAQVRCRATKDPGVKAVAVTAWADGYRAACADIRRMLKDVAPTNDAEALALGEVRSHVNDYNGVLR